MNSSAVKSAAGKEEPAEKLGEGGPLDLSSAIWGKAVSVWYAMLPKNAHYNRVRIRHCRCRNILCTSRRAEACRNTYGYRLWRQTYINQQWQRCGAREAGILTEDRQIESTINAIVSGKR